MKKLLVILAFFPLCLLGQDYVILLHGGAGNGINPQNFPPERQEIYDRAMRRALAAGEAEMNRSGEALKVVTAVITTLEDDTLFNAGRGAVYTWEERHELDASLMDGRDRSAGAVAGVTNLRNPILAAEAVLQHSPHVLLSGPGAEAFAERHNVPIVDPEYFHYPPRYKSLQRMKKQGHRAADSLAEYKMGTVGCVVLDVNGNLAAGTSTGGMTGKRHGRIGDSPIIGAGTYANNNTCAVSCTGHGEFFIRYAVAFNMHSRLELLQEDLEAAAHHILLVELAEAGGDGGLIAVDKEGRSVALANTEGMFWALLRNDREPEVGFFME